MLCTSKSFQRSPPSSPYSTGVTGVSLRVTSRGRCLNQAHCIWRCLQREVHDLPFAPGRWRGQSKSQSIGGKRAKVLGKRTPRACQHLWGNEDHPEEISVRLLAIGQPVTGIRFSVSGLSKIQDPNWIGQIKGPAWAATPKLCITPSTCTFVSSGSMEFLRAFLAFFWNRHNEILLKSSSGKETFYHEWAPNQSLNAIDFNLCLSGVIPDGFILSTRLDSQMVPTSFLWRPVELCQSALTLCLQEFLIGRSQRFWQLQMLRSSTKSEGQWGRYILRDRSRAFALEEHRPQPEQNTHLWPHSLVPRNQRVKWYPPHHCPQMKIQWKFNQR